MPHMDMKKLLFYDEKRLLHNLRKNPVDILIVNTALLCATLNSIALRYFMQVLLRTTLCKYYFALLYASITSYYFTQVLICTVISLHF